jgi:hypothetical protein
MALPGNTTPQKAMQVAWTIWGVMLGGLITLLVVFVAIGKPGEGEQIFDFFAPFVWIALAVAFGVGSFVRNQVFKRHWVGDVVEPTGFITGNVIAWAMIEAPTMVALMFLFIDGIQPHIWAALVGIGLMAVQYPSGKPMFGTSNPYQAGPRER